MDQDLMFCHGKHQQGDGVLRAQVLEQRGEPTPTVNMNKWMDTDTESNHLRICMGFNKVYSECKLENAVSAVV